MNFGSQIYILLPLLENLSKKRTCTLLVLLGPSPNLTLFQGHFPPRN